MATKYETHIAKLYVNIREKLGVSELNLVAAIAIVDQIDPDIGYYIKHQDGNATIVFSSKSFIKPEHAIMRVAEDLDVYTSEKSIGTARGLVLEFGKECNLYGMALEKLSSTD